MTNDHHPTVGGDRVAFVATDHVIGALDVVAAEAGVSRSHIARQIVADFLRREGVLPPEAPASKYEARHRARS